MTQLKTGTVDLISGSPNISFSGSPDLSVVSIDDIFIVVGELVPYEILSVNNIAKTGILKANYVGATLTGLSYSITSTKTSPDNIFYPEKTDIETATLVKLAILRVQELLTDNNVGGGTLFDYGLPGCGIISSLTPTVSQPYTPPIVLPPVGVVDGKHIPGVGMFSFTTVETFGTPGAGTYIGEY